MTKNEKSSLITWCVGSLCKRPQINTSYGLYKIKHIAGSKIQSYVSLENMCEALEYLGYEVIVKKDRLLSNAYLKKNRAEKDGGKMR
ncbi:hypothetical protein QLS91_02315 [Flavobacterium sp. LB2P84]|uniref:hypothetical protein n=1 Tax=Flavobacterium yafengii TaxID=3041253 RepID=UPI0024A861E6|nr:hypothetical protein [Flavobacterium yafengii]MDI6031900.1 hypothetical protein [Flavobacterium yafengii]